MRGHTPGPWHWVNSTTDEPFDFLAPQREGYPSLRTVAERKRDGGDWLLPDWILDAEEMRAGTAEENLANALLVAAAPDMLEALNVIESKLPVVADPDAVPNEMCSEIEITWREWSQIRAAIAKATGAA